MSETELSNERSNLDESTVPFFPDHIGLEAKVALVFGIFVIILGIIGLYRAVGLQDPADPMNTPTHVKPEWYFLALYQILKIIPSEVNILFLSFNGKSVGAILPVLLVAVLLIWPFADRKPDKSRKTTRNRGIIMLILMVILIVLTIWGEVS